ncbi:MAG: tetratricopeptide repeat protein [Thermodesulfobacteriota bacterium]
MGTWIIIGTLSLAAIIWFLLKGLSSPRWKARVLLTAYQACKESGASETECLFQMFDTRPPWNTLPKIFLRELATRLGTPENILKFVLLSEGTGILQTNILGKSFSVEHNPEFAIGGVVAAVVSRANALGNQREFRGARDVLELALLLNPGFSTAWASMAKAAFEMKDYQTALYWADRVLNYVPNPNSEDPWERAAADVMAPGGGKKAAELLGEPEMADACEQVQQQMKAIKRACSE